MKKSLRLTVSAGLAVAAAGAFSAGCETLDDLLPPGGQVSVTYYSDAATTGTTQEFASAYAWFLSDFVANDPADDPSVNPYADLPVGDCVAPVQPGDGSSQYTYADPGGVILSGPQTVTLSLYTNGELSHVGSLDPSTFPFGEFFDVEVAGSDDIPGTTFSSAIATGEELAFTAPPEMHGGLVTFDGGADLTFTYQSVVTEIMVISVTDNAGSAGLMCRVDPGAGGLTDFVIPAADVATLPSAGIIVAFTYNYRDDVLSIAGEDRSVSFIGQTIRAVRYQKN